MMTSYESRIVAFVDLLGFKQMIKESEYNLDTFGRIHRAVQIIHNVKENNDKALGGGLQKLGVEVTTFSDSAIISYPLSFDGGLFHVMLDLIHLQIELLVIGIFVRGGISIGNAYHDAYNAFGPAVVEAYRLESEKAIYPRIILTEDTIETGVLNSPSHRNEADIELLVSLLQKDPLDEFYFLDYLMQQQEFDEPTVDYYPWLKGIRNVIVSNLNASCGQNTRVYDKYVWMMNYWNSTISSKEFIIPVEGHLDEKTRKIEVSKYMGLIIDTKNFPYV